jgi:exopolysaccharide production protein ExoQ
MPPPLALLICTIFVLFLLWLERKQSPDVSFASWIPIIWMMVIASKPLAIWFGTGGVDIESGSPLDRAFFSGILCLGLLILLKRKFNWFRAIKENIWVMVVIGYMLVSIIWTDIPYISFKRWIRELNAVVMAFMIASEPNPRQVLESLFRKTIYVLIPYSVLLIKYYPNFGVMYSWSGGQMWTGICQHKNGLGRLCLISIFFLIWTLIRRWLGRDISVTGYQTTIEVFILILTLWLLKGSDSYSATSLVALAAGIATFVSLLWMKKHGIKIGSIMLMAIITFVIGFGITTVLVGGSTMGTFSSSLGRDSTLTGRTDIWAALLPVAMQHPFFGSGFGGFWTTLTRDKFQISECHNGYLEIILELGFVGILFFSIFMLSCCRKAIKALDHDFDWAGLWICFLIMTVIYNITESSINTFTSQLSAVVLFLSVSYTVPISYTPEISSKL